MNRSITSLLVGFLLLCIPANDPLSEPLEKIIKSEKNKGGFRVDHSALRKELDPDTTIGEIFLEEGSGVELIRWTTTGFEEEEVTKPRATNFEDEYVMVKADILKKGYPKAAATIAVPHPRYAPMIDFGILIPIERLKPSTLETIDSRELTLAGRKTTVYSTKKKQCIGLVVLPQNIRAQFLIKNCSDLEVMEKFLHVLTLDRLVRKLL